MKFKLKYCKAVLIFVKDQISCLIRTIWLHYKTSCLQRKKLI